MKNQRITKKGFRYEILPSAEHSPRRVKDYNEYCTLYNRLAELEDKIEDSVVLSREELSKKYVSRDTYDAEIEYRKVLEKRASKETAEKILKMLISKLESNQFLSGKRIIMEVDVENLAKQFDVEIEE